MKRFPIPSKSRQKGVVIVEAMVAILLFSIGVLAIAGLQASMIQNSSESKFRAEANYLAQQMIGRMWSDLGGTVLTNYTREWDISDKLPNGKLTVTSPSASQYDIVVTWQQEGQEEHNFTTTATVPTPASIL